MPLRSMIELERRTQANVTGGVVDEAGSVVTCVVHFGGCLYRPEVSRDDHELADLIWVGQQIRKGRTDVTAADRASLPCVVVEVSETDIRRRQERAQRAKHYPRAHDQELTASLAKHRQAQEQHTQDVREGYGDAVPEFEEME